MECNNKTNERDIEYSQSIFKIRYFRGLIH
jgi:hypothetical protein